MFNNILLIGLGGGIGSMLRYLCQRSLNHGFPYGTLLVNLAGCFIIGLAWGYFSKNMDSSAKLFLMTGLCGGFTTFSAFTQEGVQMMMDNRWISFALYAGLSVAAGLLLTFLGFKLTHV
ncbi:MAG: fluoride efflux transporter CrcB [Flavisolibacter sp.]